jgi:hypothetical protein
MGPGCREIAGAQAAPWRLAAAVRRWQNATRQQVESPAMSHSDLVKIYIAALPPDRGCDRADVLQEAEQAVAAAVAKIDAMRRNGDLKQFNAKYKNYRRTLMERGLAAIPYSVAIERRLATLLRQVAATGRMI